jgi:hypothetical protein
MPAIEFSRLRTKIELLGRVYHQPGQFLKDLQDLYFFYSDLTFQTGKSNSVNINTLQTYRTPQIINRELERLLRPRAIADPKDTLNIVDTLWQTKILEPCQLAATLLGALPITYSETVIERITNWSQSGEKTELLDILHTNASEAIRQENPTLWIETLRVWVNSKDPTLQKFGLLGLVPMLNDPDFYNLPILFDFLQPIIAKTDPHLVVTLLQIIEKLGQKSEFETVYFLKQIIKESKNPDLPRFIRRSLPAFSESAQLSLKNCLKGNPIPS